MSTVSSSDPGVLIVGAGPAGLILALSLLEQGIPIRIIDKHASHRVGSRGSGMTPRSQEVYKFLGLWPDIEKEALPVPPMRLYESPEGSKPLKTWHMFEWSDPTPSTPFMSPLLLAQSTLEAIIRKRIEGRHGISVELGTELVGFDQNNGVVTAYLRKNGTEGAEETIEVPYLIGTDGGRSIVRQTLGLSSLGETRKENWFIYGDVEIKGIDADHWHMWGAGFGGRSINIRPPDGAHLATWSFIATAGDVDEAEIHAIGSDTARAEKLFYEVSGRKDVQFGKWAYLTAHRPYIRMTDTFQQGHVFIAGDSGHSHSPLGGQGLNSCIQDSFNLAWKLALVLKGISPPKLLETYSEERVPVIAEMLQRTTKLLDQTLALKGNIAPDTSDENSAWRRGRALNQLGVNYRWSSIVIDECHSKPSVVEGAYGAVGSAEIGPLRAGDRAPDASGLEIVSATADGAQRICLFDLFNPACHTVLVFVPPGGEASATVASIVDVVKGQPAGTIQTFAIFAHEYAAGARIPNFDILLVDKDGYAGDTYHTRIVDGVLSVIVRPDGVVGGIVTNSMGVKQYFSSVFL